MKISGCYTRSAGIYIRADDDGRFSYNDGDASENFILTAIKNASDLSTGSAELSAQIHDWPTRYHFSPQRADLLRPFGSFFHKKKILEPGSGCGAITRFLGESGAEVMALEGSSRRAEITAARCRDLPNVTVVCDNIERFESPEKFDVIILTGVLEYSNLFIKGEHPAQELLKRLLALLEEDGLVFIAIENKMGLKYWAGAPEDHVGEAYYGIEDRYHAGSAETYGKQELAALLKETGFTEQEFYLPFPDYKLPSLILREKSFSQPGFNVSNLLSPMTDYSQQQSHYPAFALHRAWNTVIDNKLAAEFANSFLVVAGKTPATVIGDDVLGYAYSTGRKAFYQKENIFRTDSNGNISVQRKKIKPAAEAPSGAAITQHISDEAYFPGDIYFLKFMDIISTQGWSLKDIIDWASPYYELLHGLSEEINGIDYLPGKCVDINPFNMLVDEHGHFRVFDQEWETHEPVPLAYIFFRGLFYCFAKPAYFYSPATGTGLHAFGLLREITAHFISSPPDFAGEFARLENKYFSWVSPVDNYTPGDFPLPVIPEQSLPHQMPGNHFSLLPLTTVNVKVFFQTGGKQFSETDSVSSRFNLSGERKTYAIRIGNEEPVQKLRIDPAEQTGVMKFYSLRVKDDQGNNMLYWDAGSDAVPELNNIISAASGPVPDHYTFLFVTDDPMITLDLPEVLSDSGSRYLDIELELAIAGNNDTAVLAKELDRLFSLFTYARQESHKAVESPETEATGNNEAQFHSMISRFTRRSATALHKRLEQAGAALIDKDDLIDSLSARMAEQKGKLARMQEAESRYHSLQSENEALKKYIAWYQNTYETRSFPGLIKERLKRAGKDFYLGMLNRMLAMKFFQRKYITAYMLGFARDHGLKNSVAAVRQAFREHGVRAITQCRSIVMGKWMKMQSAAKQLILPAPEMKRQDPDLKKQINAFDRFPKISVILPAYNTPPQLLEMAIASVQNQLYENWELCIADDCSTSAATKKVLRSLPDDARIKIVFLSENKGISEASNAAIGLATGDYIALLDHDDEITPDALFWIAKEINDAPDADIIYTDECKTDEDGTLSDYFLKPEWSPELLFNMMYIGHLTVYRKSFLEERVGYFRKQYDFSQDYDLVLRATEQTQQIRHIPKVLYHWRITAGSATMGDKPYARKTNLAALEDAISRRNIDAGIVELPVANRVKLHRDHQPGVSLIIPTDSFNNLRDTLESIFQTTSYSNYEIVVVTNSGLIRQMEEQVNASRLVYVPYDLPYNFSDKCNRGAMQAGGEVIIFFNDDVRPLQADWIEQTIEFLSFPGIGGVSPKLVYEDNSIQYAGMATGVRNLTGTVFHAYPKDSTAYFNFPQLVRDVSILSGACLAIKRALFIEIGGFDAVNTPSSHSDVDLSFKIRDAGLRCVYTPYATLRHIGHLSLQEHDKKEQKRKKDKADIFLLKRWMKYLAEDPYFTKPMRDHLYHDSPEPYRIHAPLKNIDYGNKGDILLVSHDLSFSGAPIMLYDIAKALVAGGYFVVVFCPAEGPLISMYRQAGIIVVTDELVLRRHESFYLFARNFDLILCNTAITWPVVMQMQETVKTVWWLQEAQVMRSFMQDDDFISTLRHAKNLVTVSDYAAAGIQRYNRDFTKIYNACPDFYEPQANGLQKDKNKIRISLVGSIEQRKGQDILLDALYRIDPALLDKMEIWMVGRTLDPDFRSALDKKAEAFSNIYYTGEISRDEAIACMRQSDIIVNASRDDPFPIVLVEAFCMAKACVVSSNAGIAELIENGRNGFVFENENAEMLAAILSSLVAEPEQLNELGSRARDTYQKHLTMEKFRHKLLHYINDILSGTAPKAGRKILEYNL